MTEKELFEISGFKTECEVLESCIESVKKHFNNIITCEGCGKKYELGDIAIYEGEGKDFVCQKCVDEAIDDKYFRMECEDCGSNDDLYEDFDDYVYCKPCATKRCGFRV